MDCTKLLAVFGAMIFLNFVAIPDAEATAVFVVNVEYTDYEAATDYKYHVTSSRPNDSASCLSDGSYVPAADSDKYDGSKELTVVSLGPPFSGSSSRTRYVTVCKGDMFIVLEMTIELSGCAAWICDTHFRATEVLIHEDGGLHFDWYFDDVWNNSIEIEITPY